MDSQFFDLHSINTKSWVVFRSSAQNTVSLFFFLYFNYKWRNSTLCTGEGDATSCFHRSMREETAEWMRRRDERMNEEKKPSERKERIREGERSQTVWSRRIKSSCNSFPRFWTTQSSSRSMSLSFALTSLDSIGREMFYWGNSSAWTREDTRTGRRGFLRSFTQHDSHWVLISLYPLPLLTLLDAFLSGICITRCFTRFVRKQQEMKVKIWKKTQVSVFSQLLSWVFFSLTSLIIHFHHHRSLSPEFTVILPFFTTFLPKNPSWITWDFLFFVIKIRMCV